MMMEQVKAYFDYCISEKCYTEKNFEKTAKLLLELGYRTIAINQVVDEAGLQSQKKKKKGESRDVSEIVPAPVNIKRIDGCDDLKILNRLTIIFSNQEVIHKIVKSPNFKRYHIVAVSPQTQAAFQFTCSNIEADILGFDPENKVGYKINRKLYNQIINKGMHFEILYSPTIQDSTKRKNTIHTSHLYHSFGKSRNVIISSGATNSFHIRSPYDVINLALIFGLSENQAVNAVNYCGRNVHLNSVSRRLGKSVMFVENTKSGQETNEAVESVSDDEMEVDQPVQKKSRQ